jgi:hypothetical protein
MSDKEVIIILYTTKTGLWARSLVSYGIILGLIGIGILTGSDAMQWVGAILAMLSLVGMAKSHSDRSKKTPQEAADYLTRNFGVVGSSSTRGDS